MNYRRIEAESCEEAWKAIPEGVQEVALDYGGKVRVTRAPYPVVLWQTAPMSGVAPEILVALGLWPHLPTTDAVVIPPEEAAKRMALGLPVEVHSHAFGNIRNGWREARLGVSDNNLTVQFFGLVQEWSSICAMPGEYKWRIPAIPRPATKQVVIEVAADVELPGSFTIYPNEAGYFVISDNPKGVPAKVVKP